MKVRKYSIYRMFLISGLILLSTPVWGTGRLKSVQKGEEGRKAWVLLSFDQKVHWIGISQMDMDRVSLFFQAEADGLENTRWSVGGAQGRSIWIEQISQQPPVLRADIQCDSGTMLAVLKKGERFLIGFDDDRILQSYSIDVSDGEVPGSGRLTDVYPEVQGNQVITRLNFQGYYDWTGFVRISRRYATLFVHGPVLATTSREFNFDGSALRQMVFFPEEQEPPLLKARLDLLQDRWSVVNKDGEIMIQTARLPGGEPVFARQDDREQQDDVAALRTALLTQEEESGSGVDRPVDISDMEPDRPVRQPMDDSPPAGRGTPAYSGAAADQYGIPWDDIVSFRFSNTPIRDALRTVARDLNLVIGDGVKGRVTMDLEGVTFRQALDMICHTHDCDYFVDQGIITVQPVSAVLSGGRITRIYRLQYADAENVAQVLKQVVSNDSLVRVFHPEFLNFEGAGKARQMAQKVAVQGIRRSSTLVVTDRPERIREVDRIIRELDRPPAQIVIESKLVEAAPMETNELGINWDKTLNLAFQWQSMLPDGTYRDYSFLNSNDKLQGAWKVGHLSASEYTAVLDFLQEKTDSRLKSVPRIMAMDNEESSISVGTTVPVPRIQRGLGGQGDMVTFEYKEVNIQLNVTPHLTGNGEIIMYVNPVIEEITGWVEYKEHRAPITDKRTVNSIVSVKNGETVVIGGLIKNQQVRTKSKVWLLGSLPLLGKLFQHESVEDKQTDLLIFITPKLVRTG
jgi:type IV pilus secretin PilQ/predicted competence protein